MFLNVVLILQNTVNRCTVNNLITVKELFLALPAINTEIDR